jgi:hypothetical protein
MEKKSVRTNPCKITGKDRCQGVQGTVEKKTAGLYAGAEDGI